MYTMAAALTIHAQKLFKKKELIYNCTLTFEVSTNNFILNTNKEGRERGKERQKREASLPKNLEVKNPGVQ